MTTDMGTCLALMAPKTRAAADLVGASEGRVDPLHRQRPQGLTDLCHLHRDSLVGLTVPDPLTSGQSLSGDSVSSSEQDGVSDGDAVTSAESLVNDEASSSLSDQCRTAAKVGSQRSLSRYKAVLEEFDAADKTQTDIGETQKGERAMRRSGSTTDKKTEPQYKLNDKRASSCKTSDRTADKIMSSCCSKSSPDKTARCSSKSGKTDHKSSASGSKGRPVCQRDLHDLVNAPYKEGRTLLHSAAHQGDLKMVSHLLQCGAKVNARDTMRRTPLHEVAEMGYVSVAKLLLENGAKVNAQNKWKCTPLHQAVAWKQAKMVQLLLQYNAKATGGTLLQDVISMDPKEDVIIKLIQRGADVNATDMTGQTPMHTAVKYGRLHIVWLLMKNGADINKVSRGMTDRYHADALTNARHQLLPMGMAHLLQDGWSPLRMAQKYKHFDLVVWLINCGANIVVCDSTGRFPHHKATTQRNCPSLHHVLAHPNCPIDIRDIDDKTAIRLNFEAHAKSMVDSNPQCGCCSNQPNHTAGPSCDEYANTSILLLQHGADVSDLYIHDYDLLCHLCSSMFTYDLRLLQAVLLSGNDLHELLSSAASCLRGLQRQERLDMFEWLDYFVNSPRSLRDQCRLRVRTLLRRRRRGRSIWTAITALPLPHALMDFLLLQDLQGARLTRHFSPCRPPSGAFLPDPLPPSPCGHSHRPAPLQQTV